MEQNVCKVLNKFQHGKYLVAYVLKTGFAVTEISIHAVPSSTHVRICVHVGTLPNTSFSPNIRSGVIRKVDIIEATRQPFPFSFLKYRTHVLKLYIHNLRVPRPTS